MLFTIQLPPFLIRHKKSSQYFNVPLFDSREKQYAHLLSNSFITQQNENIHKLNLGTWLTLVKFTELNISEY